MIDAPRSGRILVVCTGNVCRSPYVERVLTARLADSGIEITSAGTQALAGQPMDPEAASRLEAAGGDPSGFVARQLTEKMINAADLILCATRDHRTEVVRLAPKGLRRTHALGDFADVAATLGEQTQITGTFLDPPDISAVRLVSATIERQRGQVHARARTDVDVVDPYRRASAVFDRMTGQIEALLPPVIQILRRTTSEASADQ